jgi:uncharacterized membrane protein YphA (DoxX/SURF4 family)
MTSAKNSRLRIIGLWALKTLVALAFIAFGMFKLSGQPMMVEEFGKLGLGQVFRYLTGTVEVLGAVALLVPATSRFGAVALLGVSVGACVAQASILHQDVVHTVILIATTGFLAWLGWRPRRAA